MSKTWKCTSWYCIANWWTTDQYRNKSCQPIKKVPKEGDESGGGLKLMKTSTDQRESIIRMKTIELFPTPIENSLSYSLGNFRVSTLSLRLIPFLLLLFHFNLKPSQVTTVLTPHFLLHCVHFRRIVQGSATDCSTFHKNRIFMSISVNFIEKVMEWESHF